MARRRGEEGLFSRDVDGRLVRMDKVTAADLDRDVTLKIDGRPVTVKKAVPATDSQGNYLKDEQGQVIPRATTIYDAALDLRPRTPSLGAGQPDPDPLPPRAHGPGGRLPRLRGRDLQGEARQDAGRAQAPAGVPAPRRGDDGGRRRSVARPRRSAAIRRSHADRAADGRPPHALRQGDRRPATASWRTWPSSSRSPQAAVPPAASPRPKDDSSLVIAVDHDACILCDRCVRGCNDIRNNQVIGRDGQGLQGAGSPSTSTTRWAARRASRAASAWSPARPGPDQPQSVVESDPWKDVTPARAGLRRGADRATRSPRSAASSRASPAVPPLERRRRSSAAASRRARSSAARGSSARPPSSSRAGRSTIYLNTRLKHTTSTSKAGRACSAWSSSSPAGLVSRGEDHREGDERQPAFIPIDAPVVAPLRQARSPRWAPATSSAR